MALQIVLHTLNGMHYEVSVECGSTVLDVKEQAAEQLQIPPVCQKLVMSDILDDNVVLDKLVNDDAGPLSMMLIVSDEEVLSKLESGSQQERMDAMAALVKLHQHCEVNERAIVGLTSRLTANDAVRHKAIKAITQLAEKGDERLVAAVTALLEDENISMCNSAFAATRILPRIANKGDNRVIEALLAASPARFTMVDERGSKIYWQVDHGPIHGCSDVKRAALEALPKIAEKGDDRVITALVAQLGVATPGADYALVAIEGLPAVAEKGDERVVAALSARLTDPSYQIRQAVVKVLPQVASRGDQHVIEGLTARLEDEKWFIRKKALIGLLEIVDNVDVDVMAAVALRLHDKDKDVKKVANEAIAQWIKKGDNVAITAMSHKRKWKVFGLPVCSLRWIEILPWRLGQKL